MNLIVSPKCIYMIARADQWRHAETLRSNWTNPPACRYMVLQEKRGSVLCSPPSPLPGLSLSWFASGSPSMSAGCCLFTSFCASTTFSSCSTIRFSVSPGVFSIVGLSRPNHVPKLLNIPVEIKERPAFLKTTKATPTRRVCLDFCNQELQRQLPFFFYTCFCVPSPHVILPPSGQKGKQTQLKCQRVQHTVRY